MIPETYIVGGVVAVMVLFMVVLAGVMLYSRDSK